MGCVTVITDVATAFFFLSSFFLFLFRFSGVGICEMGIGGSVGVMWG